MAARSRWITMLPESMAPPLENFERFKEFMTERGVVARREYLPEIEIDGEEYPAMWTVSVYKEALCNDGKMWVRGIRMNERDIETGWEPAWRSLVDLLETDFRHMLAEAGVAVA